MPRFHHRGPGFGHRGGPFRGGFWLVALAVFFFSGLFRSGSGTFLFWPGVLILIGISMVIASAIKNPHPPEIPPYRDPNWDHPAASPTRPTPIILETSAPPIASITPHLELLPTNCPRCGAPIRSNEIKWTSALSATCAYCGSNVLSGNK